MASAYSVFAGSSMEKEREFSSGNVLTDNKLLNFDSLVRGASMGNSKPVCTLSR